MAKSKKSPARKPAGRPVPRPPAPLVNSLPPQILEEAARVWLKSSGAAAPTQTSARQNEPEDLSLVKCLDSTLKNLRAEIANLRERIARLESLNS